MHCKIGQKNCLLTGVFSHQRGPIVPISSDVAPLLDTGIYKFIWVISLCIDYMYICSGRTQLRLLQEGAANTLERKPSRRFERYMK